jgi:hypothetical protein
MYKKFVGENPSLLVTLLYEVLMPCADLELSIFTREAPNVRREIGNVGTAVRLLAWINLDTK